MAKRGQNFVQEAILLPLKNSSSKVRQFFFYFDTTIKDYNSHVAKSDPKLFLIIRLGRYSTSLLRKRLVLPTFSSTFDPRCLGY